MAPQSPKRKLAMPEDSLAAQRLTTGQLAFLTDTTIPLLHSWVDKGLVFPSIKGAVGTGSERAFSFDDLCFVALLARARDLGISVSILKLISPQLKSWKLGVKKDGGYVVVSGVSHSAPYDKLVIVHTPSVTASTSVGLVFNLSVTKYEMSKRLADSTKSGFPKRRGRPPK